MSTKICYIDVETTGLDPDKHAIVQCAGSIEIDGKEEEVFNLKIQPRKGTVADPDALEIIGKTSFELDAYPEAGKQKQSLETVLGQYVNKFHRNDKFFFVGYNANFDMQFMRAWWEAIGDVYFGSWFYFPPLDVMTIFAHATMAIRPKLKDMKLRTVCEHMQLGWDEESAHDAMYDVEKTREIFKLLHPIPSPWEVGKGMA